MFGTCNSTIAIPCACGSVEIEAAGRPIIGAVCYCDDCQKGGRQIEALPNAAPVLDRDGGTPFIIYRKDRVRCSRGATLLKALKLEQASATNRVIATCCNSAMFLNFDDAKHWIDIYRSRFQGNAPPLQICVCTRFRPAGAEPRTGLPSYPGFAPRFLWKLLLARLGMMVDAILTGARRRSPGSGLR